MSDMSFKQAKELVEKIELSELSLKKSVEDIHKSTKNFNKALKQQEYLLSLIPKTNEKVRVLQVLVGVNIGFILGLIVAKIFL